MRMLVFSWMAVLRVLLVWHAMDAHLATIAFKAMLVL